MKKLVVFVPETHVEALKDALFDAGAGRLGDYERCSWQALGQGQTGIITHHLNAIFKHRFQLACAT